MRKILGMAVVLALGCPDGKNPSTGGGTDESTGGTSGATTTVTSTEPTSTEPTTDDSGTMSGTQTSDPTSTSTTTTTDPSGTTTTATSVGTTTGGSEIAEECGIACDKFIECRVGPGRGECVPDCVENLGDSEGACLAANEALLTCFGAMTCEELVDFFENDNPGPCAAEFDATADACGGQACEVSEGGNPQGTECSISIQCEGDPLLEMECDQKECVCKIDGMQAGDPCSADDICKMDGDLFVKADECCGF